MGTKALNNGLHLTPPTLYIPNTEPVLLKGSIDKTPTRVVFISCYALKIVHMCRVYVRLTMGYALLHITPSLPVIPRLCLKISYKLHITYLLHMD